mmetsp:Transcript_33433/g.106678  ORF Transcript_33433/g.106678 Transcript_33433/m.106678 type:complete len:506 (+) Transcript_33433:72-1589(+)
MPPSPVLLLALVVSWTGCARVWGLVPAGVLGPVSSTTSTPTTIGGTQPWIDALRVASRTSVSVQENDSVDKEGDDEADEDQTDELQSVRPELPSAPTADSEARGEAEDEDEDSSRADVRPPTFDNHRGPPRRAVKMRASPWQSVLEPDRALHVRTSEAELVSPGPALATATTRQPRVHAEPKDDAFYRKLDFAYDEAFRRLEAGERDDVRGVRVMGGFAEVDPACFRHRKHVDWVLEDDGRWAIYLTKLSLGAHQIMGFTVRNQVTIWELTAGLPDDLPPVVVSSDVAPQINILGKPTEAEVDAGIRLDTAPGGWRVVLEIEVKNLNFVKGNTRIYDYMCGWPWLRVGLVFNLWDHREDGTWVGIACVWRRDEEDRPKLDRVFDMGTCNHDGYYDTAKRQFVAWLRPLAENNQVSLSPSIDLGNFTIETVPGLPSPLPNPTRGVAAYPTDEQRQHFAVPVTAADLLYGYDHLAQLIHQTPSFEINVYDIRLSLNDFEEDWNTPKA